jgi:hypothetical protein
MSTGRVMRCIAWAALAAGCASGPPVPDWQAEAKSAMDDAVEAVLVGDAGEEARAMARAREQIARTGRLDLIARAELMRCAARVASLVFEPCERFERVRQDAAAPERAYAAYLSAAVLGREEIERLPPAQRPAASAVSGARDATAAGLRRIDDPLSRLIAVAVLFQAGKADPQMIELAADAASAHGWRRPLLAWLGVQALRAERAGATQEAARLRRRMAAVE